jgi:hypothetical protein
MKSFKSILCATLLTLAVCSSAFAGNITGGKTGTVYGNITGGRAGNITGIVADLLVTLLIP